MPTWADVNQEEYMKKFLIILAAMLIMLSLVACGGETETGTDPDTGIELPTGSNTDPGNDTESESESDSETETNGDLVPTGDIVYICTKDYAANLRTSMSYADSAISKISLPNGTELNRVSANGEWSEVTYEDEKYYISNNVIVEKSILDGFVEMNKTLTIGAEQTVNVRCYPGSDRSNDDIVITLGAGDVIEVVAFNSSIGSAGWYMIRLAVDETQTLEFGYISAHPDYYVAETGSESDIESESESESDTESDAESGSEDESESEGQTVSADEIMSVIAAADAAAAQKNTLKITMNETYVTDNELLAGYFQNSSAVFLSSGNNWSVSNVADANNSSITIAIGNTLYVRETYAGETLKTVYQLTDEEMAQCKAEYVGDNSEALDASYFKSIVATVNSDGSCTVRMSELIDEMHEVMFGEAGGNMYIEVIFNADGEYVSITSSATINMPIDEAGTLATVVTTIAMSYEYPEDSSVTITAPADADSYLSGN